jgi:hypothetical protein
MKQLGGEARWPTGLRAEDLRENRKKSERQQARRFAQESFTKEPGLNAAQQG